MHYLSIICGNTTYIGNSEFEGNLAEFRHICETIHKHLRNETRKLNEDKDSKDVSNIYIDIFQRNADVNKKGEIAEHNKSLRAQLKCVILGDDV